MTIQTIATALSTVLLSSLLAARVGDPTEPSASSALTVPVTSTAATSATTGQRAQGLSQDAIDALRAGKPWQREDGKILWGDRVFESWQAYRAARDPADWRCATPSAPPGGAGGDEGGIAGTIADCSLSLTNPEAQYDPSGVLYCIPVVVHIIRDSSGTLGNVPISRIQNQIDILNRDFNALLGGTQTDTRIQFYLATVDPIGNPHAGYTISNNSTWFNDGGSYWVSLAWDTNRYLNIYTNTAGGYLGYVSGFPAQGGLVGTSRDRVVIDWGAFGENPDYYPYHLGRTAVHEVGHYLGLFHTFQDGCGTTSCYTTGDRICDTNREQFWHSGCGGQSTCGDGVDPTDNFMDYSDDPCMVRFSAEQANRMRCTLENWRFNLADVCGCPVGEVEDCNGNCAPESWIGDGVCDDGSRRHNGIGIRFDCDAFGNDGGDCNLAVPVCGNGICDSGEDWTNCPVDCGIIGPVCGNGICEAGEDSTNCPGDCGAGGPVCGNGICEAGEDSSNCPGDCFDTGSAVQWRTEDGGNGHWYRHDIVPYPVGTQLCGLDWAVNYATQMGGHPITILSHEENAFALFVLPYFHGVYSTALIGCQLTGAGWQWVTGESFVYQNWIGGRGELASLYDELSPFGPGWRKEANCFAVGILRGTPGASLLVEWSADCNGDGIVDYGQILDGSLADADANGVPDCCDQALPCPSGPVCGNGICEAGEDSSNCPGDCFDTGSAVQWRTEDGGNGHWYRFVALQNTPGGADFDALDAAVGSVGAHLVTITSPAEWAFVIDQADDREGWIGLRANACPNWEWATGEPLAFTAWGGWNCGAGPYPNNCGSQNLRALISQRLDCGTVWDDFPQGLINVNSYLMEWSADCNGDGIVDYGQILDGSLADGNGNGVPDCCEQGAMCNDDDSDGVSNSLDNCPDHSNPGQEDCDSDGVGDVCAIADGANDIDGNGVPDSCQCIGDILADGIINGTDLSLLLNYWGTDGQGVHDADLDNDGVVSGLDLALLLTSWGPC